MPVWLTSGFIGWVIRNVLAVVGIGVVSYVGYSQLIGRVTSLIQSSLGSFGGGGVGVLGLACLDDALAFILSAYTVNAARYAFGRLGVVGGS